ncbi:unnamed protein product, partial [Pleuronectes platessa]
TRRSRMNEPWNSNNPWSATSRTTIHHPDQNATPVTVHRHPPRPAAVLVQCPYPMPTRHRVRHESTFPAALL